jgi:hypothetical protein
MKATHAQRHRSAFTQLLLAGAITTGCGGPGETSTTTTPGGTTSRSGASQTSDGGAEAMAGAGGTASSSSATGGATTGGATTGGVTGDAGGAATGGAATGGAATGGAATGDAGGAATGYPPAMLDPEYTYFGAGTRLSPLVRSIGEGVGVLTGTWIDSELSTPCHFQPASDGETRCLPYDVGGANLHYSAADCSAAFVTFSSTQYCSNTIAEATGEYFTMFTACRYEVYRLSGSVTEPTPFEGAETSCRVREPMQFPDGTQFFGVEYMPPERFVARHRVVEAEDRAPGLRAVRLEGNDGSWIVSGFRDSVRDAPCAPLGDAYAEPGRCAPAPRAAVDEYVDAQCSHLGVFRRNGEIDECGEVPEVAPRALARSVPSEDECGPASIELYEALDPVLTDRYERVGGSCNRVGDEPLEMYPAGPQIDVSTLPLVDEVSLGSGHLNFGFFAIDGVPLVPSGSLVDAETGEGCRDELFTDGVVRCVPPRTWTSSNVLFADATCSEQPIITHTALPASACVEQLPPKGVLLLQAADGACSRAARAGWLEPFTGDTFYQRTADACEPRAVADYPAADHVLLQMGEEVDPDDVFGRVEVVRVR